MLCETYFSGIPQSSVIGLCVMQIISDCLSLKKRDNMSFCLSTEASNNTLFSAKNSSVFTNCTHIQIAINEA